MNFNYLVWGPFIMHVQVNNELVDKLMCEGTTKSHNHELAGHLKHQYKYNDDTAKWFYSQTKSLWQLYAKEMTKYHGSNHPVPEYGYGDLWVNFMKPGDFNPEHIHGGDLSFVLFLDVPKELKKEQDEFEGTSPPPGSLTFSYGQKVKDGWTTTAHAVQPKTGDLWIFPSLTHHSVMPFKSDITRVSVSGNLKSNLIYDNI